MPIVLPLSEKAVALMAYLSFHPGAEGAQIVTALWPAETPERGAALLDETVREINQVTSEATGDPAPILATPESPARPRTSAHRVMVRVMGKPCVEVFSPDEPFPGGKAGGSRP